MKAAGSVDAGVGVGAIHSQPTLQLRWSNAWNLHYGGHRGAEHLDARGSVITMDVLPLHA